MDERNHFLTDAPEGDQVCLMPDWADQSLGGHSQQKEAEKELRKGQTVGVHAPKLSGGRGRANGEIRWVSGGWGDQLSSSTPYSWIL